MGVLEEGVYTIDDAVIVLMQLTYVSAHVIGADDGVVDVVAHVVDAVEEQLELRVAAVGPAVELIVHADGGLDVLNHIIGDAKVPAGLSDGVGVGLLRMWASWLISGMLVFGGSQPAMMMRAAMSGVKCWFANIRRMASAISGPIGYSFARRRFVLL